MARRKTLTDNMILKLKPEAKRVTMPDPEMRGHYVRITPKGAKSFVAVARDPNGKQVWATVGGCDVLTIAEARDKAREAIRRIKAGKPAFEVPPAKPDTLKDVAENIDQEKVVDAVRLAHETLRAAGISRPRIGVAALNPHAGDSGNFGTEEIDILAPAIEQARQMQIDVNVGRFR